MRLSPLLLPGAALAALSCLLGDAAAQTPPPAAAPPRLNGHAVPDSS